MIDRLIDFLSGRQAPVTAAATGELELAVAALLIEAARMDADFDAAERTMIERVLAERFNLDSAAVQRLIAAAERAVQDSHQLFPFTRQICKSLGPEVRIEIIEMLWRVAFADGVLDPHEDMLVRRVAGLIHVPDRERGIARKRALEKLAADKTT